MLRTRTQGQAQLETVYIEELVSPDHLLRKVQKHVDFSFIRDIVKDDYSADNGRPSECPITLFKMLLIGYLFGVRSERRLAEDVAHNVAYRWFLGYSLTEQTPGADVIWQNRKRRWKAKFDVYQGIFDKVVEMAIGNGLVDGKVLFGDGTIIKANANKKAFVEQVARAEARAYSAALDEAIDEDRAAHGKNPLPEREPGPGEERTVKVSTTDPESGFLVREGKPEMFGYTEERIVDGKYNFVVGLKVVPANVHESNVLIDCLERPINRFAFQPEKIALDSAYLSAWICHWLNDHGIFGVIAHRRFHPAKGLMAKWKFEYDRVSDVYRCPGGSTLTYRTTNRDGYREYGSDREVCADCLLRPICTQSKACRKTITRHVWEDDRDIVRQNRLSAEGKDLYALRKQTIERSFADAKELHGMRYARMRGLTRMHEQCLMTATAQNIKKLARILAQRESRAQMA